MRHPSPKSMLIFHHSLDMDKFLGRVLGHVRNDRHNSSAWDACRIVIGARIAVLKEVYDALADIKEVQPERKGSNGQH